MASLSLGFDNNIHAKGSLESVETRMNERIETQKGEVDGAD